MMNDEPYIGVINTFVGKADLYLKIFKGRYGMIKGGIGATDVPVSIAGIENVLF